jgi:hypothetical protein
MALRRERHRRRGRKVKFFRDVVLRFYIGINATAIGQCATGAHDRLQVGA